MVSKVSKSETDNPKRMLHDLPPEILYQILGYRFLAFPEGIKQRYGKKTWQPLRASPDDEKAVCPRWTVIDCDESERIELIKRKIVDPQDLVI